jgi:hypothetical protein
MSTGEFDSEGRELIVNTPCCSHSGQPVANCQCQFHVSKRVANKKPVEEPPHVTASGEAMNASLRARHLGAGAYAGAAYQHAQDNETDNAIECHGRAAAMHDRASVSARKDGNEEEATVHDKAASLHRKAISMHSSITANLRAMSAPLTENEKRNVIPRQGSVHFNYGPDSPGVLNRPGTMLGLNSAHSFDESPASPSGSGSIAAGGDNFYGERYGVPPAVEESTSGKGKRSRRTVDRSGGSGLEGTQQFGSTGDTRGPITRVTEAARDGFAGAGQVDVHNPEALFDFSIPAKAKTGDEYLGNAARVENAYVANRRSRAIVGPPNIMQTIVAERLRECPQLAQFRNS